MINKLVRLVGISVLMLLAGFTVLSLGNAQVDANSVIYNGANPQMTPTIGGGTSGTSGTGGTPAGLEHYVYVTVGNEKSNYSSNGALQDGTNGRQSVIDYQKYKDAGSPEIIEHMYLKNTNADGTKDI
ncbi:hypothetical protein OF387_18125, partial [Lentilactobacillus hilgardii]